MFLQGCRFVRELQAMQTAQAGNANGTTVNCLGAQGGFESALINVTGSFTGNVNFEATADGTNWYAISAVALSGGALVLLASAAGLFRIDVRGVRSIRARTSIMTGGSVTVTATLVS